MSLPIVKLLETEGWEVYFEESKNVFGLLKNGDTEIRIEAHEVERICRWCLKQIEDKKIVANA